jgi:hypothetical protein
VEAIVVVGVLAVITAVGLAGAAAGWARGRIAERETARINRELDEARGKAEWRVEVQQRAGVTEVIVVRAAPISTGWRPLDRPVVVASIAHDSPAYEVELEKAGIAARQRRDQLNRFRPDSEWSTS